MAKTATPESEMLSAANRISEPYWQDAEKTMNPIVGTIELLREATAEEFASPAYMAKSQEALDYAVAGMEMLDPGSKDAAVLAAAILKLARFLALDWSEYDQPAIPPIQNVEWMTSMTASSTCTPCEARAREAARLGIAVEELPDDFAMDPDDEDIIDVDSSPAPPAADDEEYPTYARWAGPIGFENQMTGDGRFLEHGSLRWENLPIPFRYVPVDVGAHDGAEVGANIDTIKRLDALEDGSVPIWGEGDIDMSSAVGREMYRQLKGGWTTGVSMDLDDVTFEVHANADLIKEMWAGETPDIDDLAEDDDGRLIATTYRPDDEVSVTTDGRIRAATMVAIPAFANARIALVASGNAFASNPNQARAPEGTPQGGQWIDTPSGILTKVNNGYGLGPIVGKVAEEGGASIDPNTLEEPTDGYMVAIQGHNREVPADEFFTPGVGEDQLYSWIEDNMEVLSKKGSHIGLWWDKENGEVVFDVSERVDTLDEAVLLGQERNQQAIYDIAAGEEIDTGGTGDRATGEETS